MNYLVSTEWLDKHLSKVKILDASWHLPNIKRKNFIFWNNKKDRNKTNKKS